MQPIRQIIAMGGGGFSMEPENPLLDNYVLSASKKDKPNICFLPTASGDAQDYIENFYNSFDDKNCFPSHLSLFCGQTPDIESIIMSQDILYVGGGNTRNMLVLWKEWNLDQYILKAYQRGTVLCGLSAGSICWFEQGLTDSVPTQLNKLDCLGIIKGSNCPHFDGESERRPAYIKLIQSGELLNGIATDDGCALHFVDEKLSKVVSSRQNAKAYAFERNSNQVRENILTPDYLGKKTTAN